MTTQPLQFKHLTTPHETKLEALLRQLHIANQTADAMIVQNAEILSLLQKAHALQPEALRIMQENDLKIEDFNDPMQKLAFTFYSMMAKVNYDIECYYENQEDE